MLTRYRYSLILLRQMVVTDFKLRYQGSALGYLWSLLKPLALFSILYVVFIRFLKVGTSVPHPAVYLLLGVVLWNFFVEVSSRGVTAIVERDDLIRKLNFPRYVIVVATAFSALINLAFNFIVIAIFMVLDKVDLHPVALLSPLLILQLFIISVAVAFFLSALYVRFRDFTYIWEVFLQAAFYATPILYPLNIIPHRYAKWLLLNPLAQIIQDTRYVLITPATETSYKLWGHIWPSVFTVSLTLIMALLAATYFRRKSKFFAEDV